MASSISTTSSHSSSSSSSSKPPPPPRLSSARSKLSASTASINMGGIVSLPKIEVDRERVGNTISTQSNASSLTQNTHSASGMTYSNKFDTDSVKHQQESGSTSPFAGLTAEELGDLEESFAVFDRNGEGTINSSKLYRVMTSLVGDNPTEAEVQDLIIANDADGGGTIEFDEYLQVMKDKIRVAPTNHELKIVYRMLDRNGSGGINLDDLTGVMRAMGAQLDDEDILAMFEAVDENGQKSITYEEFLNVVLSDDSEELNQKLQEMGIDKDYIRVVPKLKDYIDDIELD